MPDQTPISPQRPVLSEKPATPTVFTQPGGLGKPLTLESLAAQVAVVQTQVNANFQTMSDLAQLINQNGNTLNDLSTTVSQLSNQVTQSNTASASTTEALQTQLQSATAQITQLNKVFNTFVETYYHHTHTILTRWVDAELGNLTYTVPVIGYGGLFGQENAPPLESQSAFTCEPPAPPSP